MIVEKVRSLLSQTSDGGRTGLPSDDDEADPGGESTPSKLFSCPECDVVYVAVQMDVCSNCATDVREVSSSLTHE